MDIRNLSKQYRDYVLQNKNDSIDLLSGMIANELQNVKSGIIDNEYLEAKWKYQDVFNKDSSKKLIISIK